MKERPILFSSPMIRALLDGRKTQTRRIIKMPYSVDTPILHRFHKGTYGTNYGGKPFGVKSGFVPLNKYGGIATKPCHDHYILCPYGVPGDRLWVKEGIVTHASIRQIVGYTADGCSRTESWEKLRNARYMPRWASRITLEIIDVRVLRLQEISANDALAEGVQATEFWNPKEMDARPFEEKMWDDYEFWTRYPQMAFKKLWHTIHKEDGPNGWVSNPWLWAISFRKI